MTKPTIVIEDEAVDALQFVGEVVMDDCPKCGKRTLHKVIGAGVNKCLFCGHLHN